MNNLAEHLVRWRWLLFIASLLLLAWSTMSGLKRITFNSDTDGFFNKETNYYKDLLAYRDKYSNTGGRLVVVFAVKDGDIFTVDHLDMLEQFVEKAWLLPSVSRVDAITNYQHSEVNGDDLMLKDLVDNASMLSSDDIKTIRSIALDEKTQLVNRLITPDGRYALVVMRMTSLAGRADFSEALQKDVDEALVLIEATRVANPDVSLHLSGDLISSYYNIEISTNDIVTMIPMMLLVIFVLLGFLFKRVSVVIIATVFSFASTIIGLGLSGLLGISFSPMSTNMVIISIAVALAHCVHVFTHFFHEYAHKSKRDALISSLRVNGVPVTLTSVTTLIGFLTLNTSSLPPAVELGNSSSLAVIVAWLFIFTFLPTLVMVLPIKKPSVQKSWVDNFMYVLSSFVLIHKTKLLIAFGLYCVIMAVLALNNVVNVRFSELISEPHVFRTDNALLDEHFGGLFTLDYDVVSPYPDGVADVEYQRHLDAFTSWLREEGTFISVNSMSGLVKRLHQDMHGDDPAFYAIPNNAPLIAQYLLLYSFSLPKGMGLDNQISLDNTSSRVVALFSAVDSYKVFDIEKKVMAWQKANWPEAMWVDAVSETTAWSRLVDDNVRSTLHSSLIALLIISLAMIFFLRSLSLGFIGLVPNIMPAAMGFGIWYLFQGEVV